MSSRPFSGYHMTAILMAGFAVVIGVNVTMATFAVRTFGGTVVDNSYVASQRFDGWLNAARKQQRLGWRASQATIDDQRLSVHLLDAAGPVRHAIVRVELEHPLGREPDRTATLLEIAPGTYAATVTLPRGRWKLRIVARANGEEARFLQDVTL